jgi:hypothetical protein
MIPPNNPSYSTPPALGDQCPWGAVRDAWQIDTGLFVVQAETGSGFWLATHRIDGLPKAGITYVPAIWPHWWEEEAEWVYVVLGYPECFEAELVALAVKMATHRSLRHTVYQSLTSFWATPQGQTLLNKKPSAASRNLPSGSRTPRANGGRGQKGS